MTTGLLMAAFVTTMIAQDSGAAQDGFVPAGPDDLVLERLPAAPLVFAAYAIAWVAVFVYVLTLWQRLRRVENDLQQVRAAQQARRP